MTNHKCHDCGKILEPDEQLRFFENDQASGQEEGYVCKACADRRCLAIAKAHNNAEYVAKINSAIQDIAEGRGIVKTMEELNALEVSNNDDMG